MKKMVFKFKSWYITPLESDTILSYVFALNFDKLKNIYKNFENIPFNITNAFDHGYIVRPFYMWEDDKQETTFQEDIENEPVRKKLKKISYIPIDKQILKSHLKDKNIKEQEDYKTKLLAEKELQEKENKEEQVSEFKNAIPRYNKGETTPFTIDDVNHTDQEKVIYVKVYDEQQYNIFFDCLKETFETVWWWKWKSKWYGKIEYIQNQDLTEKEKEFFEYVEELKNKNKYIILNNFKPSKEDLENIQNDKSFINLNHKHTKSLDNMPFKWKMSFIEAWSFLYSDNILKWDYYKAILKEKESINFGYLF